ncbi:ACT domain-containing protein [Mucilaginibacter sp. BT774]|uniref:ACT domain-containing protein n=1 Tax=Mucilaginibacter sp. BT774 TaxID=3062276 RepID=UPI0026775808|nr:ACT domain-containing protein [Mucilaginibacter sp. BT774]MDO3626507.1 ACT domain-containing protein [Mucilaginibacter sp. BT774]
MSGETDIHSLLKNMTPVLNEGEYVFCALSSMGSLNPDNIIGTFKEEEGWTVILNKTLADKLSYEYSYVASWITLTIHSALDAVGLTAAFSKALAEASISCNVVAAYYHDHIFVAQQDAAKAMKVLRQLSEDNR